MSPPPADTIVVVMTDDHAKWALGAYGNETVSTPSLDHVASSGVRFDNGFCPTPVCSPARASFFSGLRPSQHGVHDYLGGEWDRADWLADETTLPEMLSDAGYETGLFGKWHCGAGQDERVFDRVENVADDPARDTFSLARDRRVVDHAREFLAETAEEPSFCFVGLTATHGQWLGEPERLVDRYRGRAADVPDDATYPYGRTDILHRGYLASVDTEEALAQYHAAVEGVDEQIGRLRDELDTLGLGEETLFVYTADHGHCCGHHGMWGKGNGSVPPNLLEESVRVPLLVDPPAGWIAPQVRREFVDHCDTFLTLLEAADVSPPEAPEYPGRSYRHLLADADDASDWEQVQIFEYASVDGVRTESHKLVRRSTAEDLLFDLERDRREEHDRIDDPAYESIEDRLRERLERETERYADPDARFESAATVPRHNPDEVWTR